jgi:hypothetical protein
MSASHGSRWFGLLLLAALTGAGCEKKEEAPVITQKDAGSDSGDVVLDPELAEAMALAKGASKSAPAAQPGGPPPNGVFAPGEADKEAAKGSAPKLELGSEGADPKVSLQPATAPSSKLAGSIEVSVQQGQQGGGLPISFGLELSGQKLKEAEGPAGASKVTVRVTSAKVPVAGVGKDIEADIAKLKGTRLEYVLLPDGTSRDYKLELAKGVPGDLATWAESLKDAIALVTVPVPAKPVGTGAYWMVKTREGVLGLDMVTYRLAKVEAIKDGVVTLSLSTKRYSASPKLELPGLPPGVPNEMSEFQSVSEGRLEYKAGTSFPLGGDITSALAVGLGAAPAGPPGQPRQQQGIMIQSRALLSFGGTPPRPTMPTMPAMPGAPGAPGAP